MSNVKHNWVIWWALMRIFFAFFVGAFFAAIPAIIFDLETVGALVGLFMGVGIVGMGSAAFYTIDNRVPWDQLTEQKFKPKLTRADRKELKTQRSLISLKAQIREMEIANNIKPLDD